MFKKVDQAASRPPRFRSTTSWTPRGSTSSIRSLPDHGAGLAALRVKPEGVNNWNGRISPRNCRRIPGHDYVYKYPGEHGDEPDVICLAPTARLAARGSTPTL